MLQTSTVTQKGQVTIPYFIRERLSLKTGMKVVFKLDNDSIRVDPLPSFFEFRGTVKPKKRFDIKKMRQAAQKYVGQKYGKSS